MINNKYQGVKSKMDGTDTPLPFILASFREICCDTVDSDSACRRDVSSSYLGRNTQPYLSLYDLWRC